MGQDEILDTSTLIQGKGGTATIFSAIEFPKAVQPENEFIFPTRKDFVLSIEIATNLLRKGKPLPAVDVVISSMCLNRNAALRTRDAHFKVIQELYPGFELLLEE
jgi:hypothetical protein